MSIADKLQTILENEQKVYNAGYEKGKSEGTGGEKPTLFAPSIALQSVTSVLTITDDNGGFVEGYNIFANDNLITVLTSKEVTLSDYIEHTGKLNIKVQAVGANFNSSSYSNVVEWVYYAETGGTLGLTYRILTQANTFARCTGIGTATATDIIIASEYEGVPVTEIADSAFRETAITSLVIPDSITYIGGSAFMYCRSLTNVVIPDSVTKISQAAFLECSSLISVVIGNGVNSIIAETFYNCFSLKRVDFSTHTKVPALQSTNNFKNASTELQIKVPASLIDEWKTATNWSEYADKIVTEFTNTL